MILQWHDLPMLFLVFLWGGTEAVGENWPSFPWESWLIFTRYQIRPLVDLFPSFAILICLSFTDKLLIVSLACFCFSYLCLLHWGRNDTGTVAWKFSLLLKICKLVFGSCQILWVLYGWCKYLAILQLIAICINMEESVVLVYAWIYVNIWKFM